jgi:hypothetical protein
MTMELKLESSARQIRRVMAVLALTPKMDF